MAEPTVEYPVVASEAAPADVELKTLGFLKLAATYALTLILSVYGSLKSIEFVGNLVRPVEDVVYPYVGPVSEKFLVAADAQLKYIDDMVTFMVFKLSNRVSQAADTVTSYVPESVKNSVDTLKGVSITLKEKGVKETVLDGWPSFRSYLLLILTTIWKAFLALPLAPQFSNSIGLPVALFAAKTYNKAVSHVQTNQIPLIQRAAPYIPVVPVEVVEASLKEDIAAALKSD